MEKILPVHEYFKVLFVMFYKEKFATAYRNFSNLFRIV